MSEVQIINSSLSKVHPISPDQFSHLDAMQARVDTKKMEVDLTPDPLRNVPLSLQKEALAVVDELCKQSGQEPVSRRLAKLMARVAEATEKHISTKKEDQHTKKEKIDENILVQKSWKNYQAWTHGSGGFGTIFLSFAGAFLGEPLKGLLHSLSQLPQQTVQAASTWMDGQQLPLQHEQSFFLNTTQMERQSLEGLKNLPKEMQQLVQKLIDLELQACRAISQR